MKIFTLSTISIVLDAVPFLLLGSLIASAIEVLVPRELLERRIPKNRVLQMFCGLSMGLVLPTCECGIVPVVRRLMKKGVAPRVAMSYMLAAPVVNPLSIVSTYVAFPNMPVIIPSGSAWSSSWPPSRPPSSIGWGGIP